MNLNQNYKGRCVDKTETHVTIFNSVGRFELPYGNDSSNAFEIGDIIEITVQNENSNKTENKNRVRRLTANTSPQRSGKFTQRVLDPRRVKALKTRARVEGEIKNFFLQKDFIDVKTPLLVKSPGMEPHIRPYRLTTGEFIPTSPEFAMKKLLVGGLEKIFQICPSFRSEPASPQHSPEFTILEWYRAYSGYEEIMEDFENLVEALAVNLLGKPEIIYQGRRINVKAPWPRLKVRDLFIQYAGVDLLENSSREKLSTHMKRLNLSAETDDTWDDLYFKIWLNHIENKLPEDQAVIVYRYPPSQSALSVIDADADGSLWARRFEPYAGGLELGNAFEELTDPREQKRRFIEDMDLREKIYGTSFPKNPVDDDFILALEEGMPPSGGIAVGVDRLVMLLADEPDIDFTLWLPSYVV